MHSANLPAFHILADQFVGVAIEPYQQGFAPAGGDMDLLDVYQSLKKCYLPAQRGLWVPSFVCHVSFLNS